jgi:hypothetical protein
MIRYLTLYPSPDLIESEVMHVSDLTTLSPGEKYYLASGNEVEIIGGMDCGVLDLMEFLKPINHKEPILSSSLTGARRRWRCRKRL